MGSLSMPARDSHTKYHWPPARSSDLLGAKGDTNWRTSLRRIENDGKSHETNGEHLPRHNDPAKRSGGIRPISEP
jgi:hypothetical protein